MEYTLLLTGLEKVMGKSSKRARDNYAFNCPFCNHKEKKLEIKLGTTEKGENMVKRFVIIFFLLTQSVLAECKYYAEADVVNDELVNKKEHYTCEEKDNFFVQFITDEKYENSFIILVMALIENL